LQNINKKNLYKLLFIIIILGFIISLVGCNWLSLGLLNVFDPQAQIRVNYTNIDLTEGEGTIALEVYSLNEVEFIGTGFEYDYYNGTTKISSLSKIVGATFYVEPSTAPGTPGPTTTIDLPLYYQEAQDYVTSNPLITEITCTINLIGTDGAGHSITKSITFDLPALEPGVDFVPPTAVITVTPGTEGEAPFSVVLDASSSTDDREIASYSWTLGDGTTGSGILVSHTYTNSGAYIIVLTVTDYFGNKGYATEVITVGDAGDVGGPTAIIQVLPGTTGTVPFEVAFDASGSTVSSESGCSCSISSYGWDFGDTSTGTGIATTHTYTTAGTYIVILTVTDSNGKVGYATVVITVTSEGETEISTITLSANPESNVQGGTSTISAIVTNTEGDVVVDGTTVYFYTNNGALSAASADTTSGMATVTLTLSGMQVGDEATVTAFIGAVTGSVGVICTDEVGGPIAVINTVPDPVEGKAPLKVYFDAYSSTAEVAIDSYEWDFGDGSTIANGINVNHTYDEVGTYTAVLTVTDSNIKKDNDYVYVTVTKGPTAVINTTPAADNDNHPDDKLIEGNLPFKVYFDAYGSDSESGIDSYEWEFGDGDTGSGISANHTYNVPGIYIVYLTITDNNGYEAYDSAFVAVGAAGAVNAVIEVTPVSQNGTDPFTVGFDASDSTTSASGATITSFTWDFDNGVSIVTHNEPTPIPVETYTFSPAGTHLVQLTVEDSLGNIGYAFKSIVVLNPEI
jgi:PKD repeat protein